MELFRPRWPASAGNPPAQQAHNVLKGSNLQSSPHELLSNPFDCIQPRQGTLSPARLRRNQRNLTAENAKIAEVECILFVFSVFLCGKNLRGRSICLCIGSIAWS